MLSRSQLLTMAGFLILLMPRPSSSAIFPQDRGAWPKDWPQEFEPLRESSRTVGVGTGIQENIYEIPIPDAETFAKVWPAVLKLRSPGSPLVLYRMGDTPPKNWGRFLSNARPAIRIYAPSGGYTSKEANAPGARVDYEQLIKQGRALRAGAPWPESIVGEQGELPRYVVAEQDADGKLTWVPADPFDAAEPGRRGFYNRARIDVELVVDGEIIDLNQLEFPDGAPVTDHRFDSE